MINKKDLKPGQVIEETTRKDRKFKIIKVTSDGFEILNLIENTRWFHYNYAVGWDRIKFTDCTIVRNILDKYDRSNKAKGR
jgi:hypothetical protein